MSKPYARFCKICGAPRYLLTSYALCEACYLAAARRKSVAAYERKRSSDCRRYRKLSSETVKTIRRRFRADESINQIARDYHIFPDHVRQIVRRKIWAWLEDEALA